MDEYELGCFGYYDSSSVIGAAYLQNTNRFEASGRKIFYHFFQMLLFWLFIKCWGQRPEKSKILALKEWKLRKSNAALLRTLMALLQLSVKPLDR